MSKFRLALVLVSGMLSGAGTEGWLKIGQKTYSLRYAYAVPSPNALPSEKANGTWDIYVVVTDTAIPAKTFGDPFWYSHTKQNGAIHGLIFMLDSGKKLIGDELLAGKLEAPRGPWGTSDFAVGKSDGKHLEGAGKVALPEISFDLKVDAEVWQPPVETAPTAEDGRTAAASPQAKCYLAMLAAVKSGNAAAFQQQMSSEARKEMAGTAAELAMRMKILQQMSPKNPRFVRLTVEGGSAELLVADGKESSGTVTLVLESGQWKIRNVDWN